MIPRDAAVSDRTVTAAASDILSTKDKAPEDIKRKIDCGVNLEELLKGT